MHNIIIFSVFSATTAYGNGIGVSNIIIEVITHSGWDDRQYRLNRGTTIALRVVALCFHSLPKLNVLRKHEYSLML